MKTTTIFSVLIVLFFSSCSSEKSEVYDKAVEYVKERLKSPSSAKFESYRNAKIVIIDSAGTGNPFRENREEYGDTSNSYKYYDDTIYSTAVVKLTYEAQNAFGVFLRNKCSVYLKKWNFNTGPSDWEVFHISDNE